LNIEGSQEDMLQNSRVAEVIGTGRIQVERGEDILRPKTEKIREI
jgi:hypothetical protein